MVGQLCLLSPDPPYVGISLFFSPSIVERQLYTPLVLTHLYRAAIYDPIVCLSFLPRERREKWEGIAPYLYWESGRRYL